MPNDFANIEQGAGLLKEFTPNTVSSALEKKRKKLAETKLGLVSTDEEVEE